jgi:hypothetical protein
MTISNADADRLSQRIGALRTQHPDMTHGRARVVASRQLAEESRGTWLILADDVEHLTSEELKVYMGQFPFDDEKRPTVRFSDDEERERAAQAALDAQLAGAEARQEDRQRRARIEKTRQPFEQAWQQDVDKYGAEAAGVYGLPVDERLHNAAARAASTEEAARFREAIGYKPPKSSWFDGSDDETEAES